MNTVICVSSLVPASPDSTTIAIQVTDRAENHTGGLVLLLLLLLLLLLCLFNLSRKPNRQSVYWVSYSK